MDSLINTILWELLSCKTIFYSNYKESELKTANCFVIDTIGLLSKIYAYADISYVGGGMGNSGLHNILEPAAFGSPIIIGKNYKNFPEAESLIKMKGVYAVKNKSEFESIILKFTEDKRFRELTSDITKKKTNVKREKQRQWCLCWLAGRAA